MQIKEMLQSGRHVAYRSSGNSLAPRVRSNDMCEYEPVTRDDQVHVGDIVFCQIKERFWAHLVLRKELQAGLAASGRSDWYRYTISNLKEYLQPQGYTNGYTSIDKIYGRLIGSYSNCVAYPREQAVPLL